MLLSRDSKKKTGKKSSAKTEDVVAPVDDQDNTQDDITAVDVADSPVVDSETTEDEAEVTNIDVDSLSEEKLNDVDTIDEHLNAETQIRLLFKSHIKILTADGEFLHRPSEQQEIMALYENGIFLVSKSHLHDPYVLKLEAYARLKDIEIKRKIPVSLEIVRDAYKHYVANSSLTTSSATDLTKMQKDIVDVIQRAVDNDVSDIHIISSEVSAIVEMRRNGVLKQEIVLLV